MATLRFNSGTDILRSTPKADTFIVTESSSLSFEADRIINFNQNDRIDLPGDWTRKGRPLTLRQAGALTLRDGVFDIIVSDESAIKTRPGSIGSAGLFGLDFQGSGISLKGSFLAWFRDEFNENNNPAIILKNYNGPVMII
jgi:hypothetical protein